MSSLVLWMMALLSLAWMMALPLMAWLLMVPTVVPRVPLWTLGPWDLWSVVVVVMSSLTLNAWSSDVAHQPLRGLILPLLDLFLAVW